MPTTITNLTASSIVLPSPINENLAAGASESFPYVEFDDITNDSRFIALVNRRIISVLSQDNRIEDLPLKNSPVGVDVVEIESAADNYAKRRALLSSISGSIAHAVSHTNGADQIADATTTAAGFLSAADKIVVNHVIAGETLMPVRNETGGPLAKGTLVASSGYSDFHGVTLVQYADKDMPLRQPCLGAVYATIPDNTDGQVLIAGPLVDVDTSLYNLNDVLVLGSAGAFSLAPPTQSPFAGNIHTVGMVTKVSGPNGIITMLAPLPSMVTGPQVFALEGTSGTPGPANKYVTDLDPRLDSPPNYFTVAASGADYTSIKSAIDAAIAAGATTSNPYGIRIFPGTYTELPMTVPPGIIVSAVFANRTDTVYVVAQNAAQDLFTMTGGYILGLMASGVTDATKACFRINGPGVLATLHGVAVRNCSSGVVVSGGAACILTNFSASILGAGQRITTAIQCTGAGSYLGVAGVFFSVPAALLALYPGVNPIQTCVSVQASAKAFISACTANVAYNVATADVLFTDTGASTTVTSWDVVNCATGLRIGSTGANTEIICSASNFTNNNINANIESATGIIFANASSDTFSATYVSGAKCEGVLQIRDDATTRVLGGFKYQFPTGKSADFADLIEDYTSTGVCEGGGVTDAGGLDVAVTDGDAWINRSVEGDAFWVEWTGATLSLTNNATNYVYFDSASDALTFGPAAPGEEGVVLAVVITRGGVIRYLHTVRQPIDLVQTRLYNYLADTRKRMSRSGMAVSAGSTARRIDVDPGSYYLALDIIQYAGATDGAFSAFYGTNGASEDTGVVDIDITNYDNAGAKAALAAGHFRCDTLHVTSDGRLCVVYGKVDHAVEANAVAEPSVGPPTFVELSSFPLAKLIVQEAVGITQILDIRPTTSTAAGAGGTVASHSALANLNALDHPQYFRVSGADAMAGGLDMGGFAISNVGNVDGVDVSAHAARHNPGGADTLAIGNPVDAQIGGASADGMAASYARADHLHAVPTAVPVAIGTANDVGAASTGSRSDHVHAHGNQTVDTLHAVAVAGVSAGFISASNQAVLDDLVAGHTLIQVRNETGGPIARNKLVAVAGWDAGSGLPLVWLADKDDGDKRPAIGVVHGAAIPDATNGQVLISGVIEAVDTSTWNITDQLVLGTNGDFSRPPPDVDPFTGEIQNAGSVIRVNAVDGKILFIPDGMSAVASQEVFALVGTSGTPSKTNKYVTDADARNTNNRAPTAHATSHVTGADQIGVATLIADGLLSAADKTKLNGIETGATNSPLSNVDPVDVAKTTASEGVSTESSRRDHQHSVDTAAPTTIGTANAEGAGTSLARASHVHAHGNQSVDTLHAVAVAGVSAGFISAANQTKLNGIEAGATASPLSNIAPVNVTKAVAAAGTEAESARRDHKHDVSTATPVAGGVVAGGVAAEGTLTTLARSDHIHAVSVGTPVSVGLTSAEGDATSFSRSNHVHAGLPRTGNDFLNFTQKATPLVADLVLIESTADGYAKRYCSIGTLPKPTVTLVEDAGTDTTGSATDVVAVSMTTTPVAGTYLVTFSGSMQNTANGSTVYASIWYNGAQIAASERRVVRGTQPVTAAFSCQAKITAAGGIAVEGRWRVSTAGNAGSMFQRTLTLLPVA